MMNLLSAFGALEIGIVAALAVAVVALLTADCVVASINRKKKTQAAPASSQAAPQAKSLSAPAPSSEAVPSSEPASAEPSPARVSADEGEDYGYVIRYNRSFRAKLIQADDDTKEWYTDIKNALVSHKGMREHLSWKHERFTYRRTQAAKFMIRGTTLCLYLPVSAADYEGSKYKLEDVGEYALYRIKNERRARYAVDLICKLLGMEKEARAYYADLAAEFSAYRGGVKLSQNFRGVRVHKGRTPFALLSFKGKKMCAAFALDPADYAETKYRGKDVGDSKRYERTPMLLKLTPRKAKYAKLLFADVAVKNGLLKGEPVPAEVTASDEDTLLNEGAIRVTGKPVSLSSGEPDDTPAVEYADIADFIEEIEPAEETAPEETEDEEPLRSGRPARKRRGSRKTSSTVSTESLNRNFRAGERVTLEALLEKEIVPKGTVRIKVLMGGALDKPLTVEADDFSDDAAEAILAVGGTPIKV